MQTFSMQNIIINILTKRCDEDQRKLILIVEALTLIKKPSVNSGSAIYELNS